MAEKKKSFVFNVEWQEILLAYPAEVRLEVYDAIIEYVASGTVSELKPMAKMAFSFIKKEIDYNNEKYNSMIAKRSEAGKKGMSNRYQTKEEDSNKSNTCYQDVTNLTSDNKSNTCYQKVTNVTDNVNDNDIYKETTTKVVAKKAAAKAATLSRKEEFYKSLIPFTEVYPKDMIRDFFDYWSEMNKSCTKMRWEQERTWETARRLITWANRENNYSHGNNNRSADKSAKAQQLISEYAAIEQGLDVVGDKVKLPDL